MRFIKYTEGTILGLLNAIQNQKKMSLEDAMNLLEEILGEIQPVIRKKIDDKLG